MLIGHPKPAQLPDKPKVPSRQGRGYAVTAGLFVLHLSMGRPYPNVVCYIWGKVIKVRLSNKKELIHHKQTIVNQTA